ncbi:Hypothetical predicted protein [Olea europaea subsp. europaea]|uniref:Uncharacterized protein n=1 Tax=Olea europaea subsp. europaea TaxID=158383 RepID=A0A8S0S8J8_OLEEU|nr:Hypothetical predicted protein [Olea europaea subsp. europaea]
MKRGRLRSKVLEGERIENGQNNSVLYGSRKSNVELEGNANGGGSSDSGMASYSEDRKDMSDALVPDYNYEADMGKIDEVNGNGDGEKLRSTDGLPSKDHLMSGERFKSGMLKNNKSKVGFRSTSSMKKGSSSPRDEESDSETDTTSSSDPERERERAERIKDGSRFWQKE